MIVTVRKRPGCQQHLGTTTSRTHRLPESAESRPAPHWLLNTRYLGTARARLLLGAAGSFVTWLAR